MGNSAYGLGWYNGNEEGYKNGYLDGECDGVKQGIYKSIIVAATMAITIGSALFFKTKNKKKKAKFETIERYKDWEIYKRSNGMVDAAKDDEVMTAENIETLRKMIDAKENISLLENVNLEDSKS